MCTESYKPKDTTKLLKAEEIQYLDYSFNCTALTGISTNTENSISQSALTSGHICTLQNASFLFADMPTLVLT